jgi:hypothetical protein
MFPPNDVNTSNVGSNLTSDSTKNGNTGVVGAFDPNNMEGPTGFGAAGFLPENTSLPYTISFENDPQHATAPAQVVTVTNPLSANLDWSTFALGSIGFGSTLVQVPDGRQSYSTSVDTTNPNGSPLRVQIDASLDRTKGIATWTFRSLDPTTSLPPSDALAGFLPIDNPGTHSGEGFVSYTIQPKAGRTTGTSISNVASIVFDENASLNTPTISNALDAGTPASDVKPLTPKENSSFIVKWSGVDDAGGSGVATYDVYKSDNGANYNLWQKATTATFALFANATANHTYRFFVVATDNVGHVEKIPATFDAQTLISNLVWQNAENRLDVDHDTFVVAADVLAVINYINANKSGLLPAVRPSNKSYVDVTGDKSVAADDVITIINWINAHPGQSEAEDVSGPISSAESYFDALRGGQMTTVLTASPARSAAESLSDDTSMVDLVSLLAADISSQEAKRRRL